MISTFKLANQGKAISKEYGWTHDVHFLANNPEIEFTPGLNIVFGPNGSGKSTLISLCAELLFAKQAGYSVLTKDALTNLFGFGGGEVPPAELSHDGQPVMYANSRQAFGLIGNGAAFDDEFFSAGMRSLADNNQSSGQVTSSRIHDVVSILMDETTPNAASKRKAPKLGKREAHKARSARKTSFPTEIEHRLVKENVNDTWGKRVDLAHALLLPTIEAGPRTILLDEPESGFSLLWQANFWQNVMRSKQAQRFQIILATHSPFALNVPGANYIETEPGYVAMCRELFATITPAKSN